MMDSGNGNNNVQRGRNKRHHHGYGHHGYNNHHGHGGGGQGGNFNYDRQHNNQRRDNYRHHSDDFHGYQQGGKDGQKVVPLKSGQQQDMFFFGNMHPFHASLFHPLSSTITVAVHGIAPSLTLAQLKEKFATYGKPLRVWCIEGTPDVGMVTYKAAGHAEAAIIGSTGEMFHGTELKVTPSMYSAAPSTTVKPGDLKYWRCFLCHNTNRTASDSCSAYRCTQAKELSDADWAAEASDSEATPEDAASKRWELSRQYKQLETIRKEAAKPTSSSLQCLLVMNLSNSFTDVQVKRAFARYGAIKTVRLLPCEAEPNLEAQIVFEDSASLEAAIESENGKRLGNQRIRVHRVHSPCVLTVTAMGGAGWDCSTEEAAKTLSDTMFAAFREFTVVMNVQVTEESCRIEVCSMRGAVLSIANLDGREICDCTVSVTLAPDSKWPCLSCCNTNPPQAEDQCMDCRCQKPFFHTISLPRLWYEALRRVKGSREPEPGKGSPTYINNGPRVNRGHHHHHHHHHPHHHHHNHHHHHHNNNDFGIRPVSHQYEGRSYKGNDFEGGHKGKGRDDVRQGGHRNNNNNNNNNNNDGDHGPNFYRTQGNNRHQKNNYHNQRIHKSQNQSQPQTTICSSCGKRGWSANYLSCNCCSSYFCNDHCRTRSWAKHIKI